MAIASLALWAPGAAWAEELGASEIIERMSEERGALGVREGRAEVVLRVEGAKPGEAASERSMTIAAKRFGDEVRSRVTLTAPAELKGQAFLFAPKAGGEDDVWMYLPAFSAVRRIAGTQRNGAFLGSHVTFADLEFRDVRGAVHKRLPDESIGQTPVYVVDAAPSEPGSAYAKVRAYVRKSDFMPLKFRFFDRSGEVKKTLFVERIERSERGPYISQMTIRPATGGATTMRIVRAEAAESLPDSLFSKSQLGN